MRDLETTVLSVEPITRHLAAPLRPVLRPALHHLLCVPRLNRAYASVTGGAYGTLGFCDAALRLLEIRLGVQSAEIAALPRRGPLVVVANHPFGGIEGLILARLLQSIRPDARLLANALLAHLPAMAPSCIFVDPLHGRGAHQANARGLAAAIRWVRGGGALGLFPGGEVASLQLTQRRVTDPPWHEHLGALLRRTGATVVPLYFSGRNSALFQIAGLLHERLRTVLLPRELFKKKGETIRVHVGRPIPPERLRAVGGSGRAADLALADYLRGRTLALAARAPTTPASNPDPDTSIPEPGPVRQPAGHAPPRPHAPPPAMRRELEQQPASARLASHGSLVVYHLRMREAPRTLAALGRLREITFRAVGEGTGRHVDLDAFDATYEHLVLFDWSREVIAGSYRLGPTDALAGGRHALYTHTLFRLDPLFLRRLAPALELGRSFVRQSHQRQYAPLMLLWRGLGAYVARRSRYRYLFGPVTISSRYRPASQALMVDLLSRPAFRSGLAPYVQPRRPFNLERGRFREIRRLAEHIETVDHLDEVVRDIEPDRKGIPVLLRQYLKLGARRVAFNRDPDFGNCLDCLCVLDLCAAPLRILKRYLGPEAAERGRAAAEQEVSHERG